jgi:transitional endoplasmic reticulum ATPase
MADPAIDGLRAALQVAPGDEVVRLMLARRLAEAGRPVEAVEQYQVLLRTRPHATDLRTEMCEAYLAAGRHGPAEMVAADVLRDDPTSGAAHLLLARAQFAGGDTARATESYRRAVGFDPKIADEEFAVRLGMASPAPVADPGPPAPATGAGPWLPGDGAGSAPAEPTPVGPILYAEDTGMTERPTITFAAVGGMDAVKEEIRLKIIYPRQHPEIYKAYGKKAGGGILLYGPPGCGKTHIARATAGELGSYFVSVGISDVLEMWLGNSERNLHRIFEVARAHTPCVLFFDEVDALAASRDDFKHSAGRTVINQFLAEMDGTQSANDGLLVMGATNAPWHLDSAFRRPGRFDQIVFVPPPDLAARTEILRVMLRDKPAAGVDIAKVAAATDRWSGADLMGMIERATESKIGIALRTGIPTPIETGDLLGAARAAGPTTVEWFATVRNYVLYANEGGLYDPVRPYIKGR